MLTVLQLLGLNTTQTCHTFFLRRLSGIRGINSQLLSTSDYFTLRILQVWLVRRCFIFFRGYCIFIFLGIHWYWRMAVSHRCILAANLEFQALIEVYDRLWQCQQLMMDFHCFWSVATVMCSIYMSTSRGSVVREENTEEWLPLAEPDHVTLRFKYGDGF